MLPRTSSIWQHDSQPNASGKPGAVHNTGRVRGYTGHHINNAATAPAWEGDPRNIRFLSNGRAGLPNDHLYADQGHRGNWQNSTRGRLIDRMEMVRRFRAGCL